MLTQTFSRKRAGGKPHPVKLKTADIGHSEMPRTAVHLEPVVLLLRAFGQEERRAGNWISLGSPSEHPSGLREAVMAKFDRLHLLAADDDVDEDDELADEDDDDDELEDEDDEDDDLDDETVEDEDDDDEEDEDEVV